MNRLAAICFLILIGLVSCLDPYEPPVSNESADFLVVDGFINVTNQIAEVKLTRGVPLSNISTPPEVNGANVTIQSSSGQVWTLFGDGFGKYTASSYFDSSDLYRLKIRLSSGKIYLSDWIKIQKNSSIDNLRWEADDEFLKFYVSTSANGQGPFYYRYAYEETHEYRSVFASSWKISNASPIYRTESENISSCWTTANSTSALLTSTEGLSQNVISDFNVLRISKGDRRLWFGYSLLVKQYALDQAAYTYWDKLKKVSESLGGLFDPIPFSVTGNIFADFNEDTLPDEQSASGERALGYFSGGEVSEKRINIRNFELPRGYYGFQKTTCTEAYAEIRDLPSILGRDINLTRAQYDGLSIIGFYYAIPACTDCRLEGGSSLKPIFMD